MRRTSLILATCLLATPAASQDIVIHINPFRISVPRLEIPLGPRTRIVVPEFKYNPSPQTPPPAAALPSPPPMAALPPVPPPQAQPPQQQPPKKEEPPAAAVEPSPPAAVEPLPPPPPLPPGIYRGPPSSRPYVQH